MGRLIDLVGKKFNYFTVIKRVADRNRAPYWLCRCECGTEKEIEGGNLRSNRIRSCGCAPGNYKVKHGMCKTAEYKVWQGMLRRCTNHNDKRYAQYGGRGISVCDRWRSFENFYADMGDRPSDEHQIDRENNDGNYEPGNCRWATRTQQCRNKSANVMLTIGSETLCAAEWAERSGVSHARIRHRLRLGWSSEDAVFLPVKSKTTTNRKERK